MGCFDSFYIECACPYCGNVAEVEFQTKKLGETMSSWKKGDRFLTSSIDIWDGIIKDVYGACRRKDHEDCGWQWERKNRPNCWGFGRPFDVDVIIRAGRVDGITNIRKREDDDE